MLVFLWIANFFKPALMVLSFQVVVLTNSSLEEQKNIGEITHKNDISLIIAQTKGLFG